MAKFGMGQPVKRLEDQKFITGAGRYTDDIALPGSAHGFVLRSPYAHAKINSIDTAEALKTPGVLLVLTSKDIAEADYGTLPCMIDLKNRDGSAMAKPERPILATDYVRHVGDPIAFIVAETIEAARDAAERVEIDYDMQPAIADTEGALAADAPQVWAQAPSNLCFDWGIGDFEKAEALRKSAARVVELKIINNRVISNSIEPRNALGQFENGRYTLTVSSQGSHTIQGLLAERILKISKEDLRVITPDVGGGFGTKIFIYPELPLVLLAAKKIGRPVRWIGERSDSFLSDAHGRDHVTTARLSLDKDHRFLGLEVDMIANLGAYLSHYGPFIPTMAGAQMYVGVYKWDAVAVHVKGVFTNTTPVDAYRGAGRPEAAYLLERLIDHAAAEIGVAPAELRRINFVKPADMPYQTFLGHVYDSGDFARNMDDAMAQADVKQIAARKSAAKAKGKLRGLGIATYIEACGGGGDESAWIDVGADGKVVLMVGSQNNGQGHWTSYAQLVADKLGIDIHDVTLVQGDTDVVPTGKGTGGSRAIPVGGAATVAATDRVIEKGKRFAAHYLETAAADIEFADATFTVAGTDKKLSLIEVAKRAAFEPPPGEEAGLKATDSFKPPAATFPNGCHVCEVEIDPATGAIEIPGYWVVDDFGTILNPMMLAGQVHGGVAQGLGQALMELCRYDEAGQLLTGSFMDYTMPRADDLPHINFQTNIVPCTTNPLGVKGAGEAGAIGAPPAIVNAVVDALREHGVSHIDMPLTAEKVWRAIEASRMPLAAD